jgi:hypothetical protein
MFPLFLVTTMSHPPHHQLLLYFLFAIVYNKLMEVVEATVYLHQSAQPT